LAEKAPPRTSRWQERRCSIRRLSAAKQAIAKNGRNRSSHFRRVSGPLLRPLRVGKRQHGKSLWYDFRWRRNRLRRRLYAREVIAPKRFSLVLMQHMPSADGVTHRSLQYGVACGHGWPGQQPGHDEHSICKVILCGDIRRDRRGCRSRPGKRAFPRIMATTGQEREGPQF
jgi:hypothetical protein